MRQDLYPAGRATLLLATHQVSTGALLIESYIDSPFYCYQAVWTDVDELDGYLNIAYSIDGTNFDLLLDQDGVAVKLNIDSTSGHVMYNNVHPCAAQHIQLRYVPGSATAGEIKFYGKALRWVR